MEQRIADLQQELTAPTSDDEAELRIVQANRRAADAIERVAQVQERLDEAIEARRETEIALDLAQARLAELEPEPEPEGDEEPAEPVARGETRWIVDSSWAEQAAEQSRETAPEVQPHDADALVRELPRNVQKIGRWLLDLPDPAAGRPLRLVRANAGRQRGVLLIGDAALLFGHDERQAPATIALADVHQLETRGNRRPTLHVTTTQQELSVEGSAAELASVRALLHDLSWQARIEPNAASGE
jgi:hypothetical protein